MNDLSAIVTSHGEAVWCTAYRLLNHYEDALDCYQETFLAAMRVSKTQPVDHWRTLLVRIATRRAIDCLRNRAKNGRTLQAAIRDLPATPSVPAVDTQLQASELREQVRRALAQLPPLQGEAFWLRHLEHLTVEEIAREMQIDAGYVRVLVHRAATALRSYLSEASDPTEVPGEVP